MSDRICSGLGALDVCPRRENCQRYVGWWLDSRSEFALCHHSSGQFAHFIALGTATPAPAQGQQLGLFEAEAA